MTEQVLSEADKKRILREKRQAKMKQGKASERLNQILSQGTSSKGNTVSVLDANQSATTESEVPSLASDEDPGMSLIEDFVHDGHHGDNDVFNIEKTLDKMFLQGQTDMFKQGGFNANLSNQFEANNDSLNNTGEIQYQEQLSRYNAYQQNLLRFRVTLIRFLSILINFFYHYSFEKDYFQASSNSLIRETLQNFRKENFFVIFLTFELILLSSFYVIGTKKRIFINSNGESRLIKLLSMASIAFPQIKAFEPLLVRLLVYWEIFSMLLTDISLIVFLFGITSLYK